MEKKLKLSEFEINEYIKILEPMIIDYIKKNPRSDSTDIVRHFKTLKSCMCAIDNLTERGM